MTFKFRFIDEILGQILYIFFFKFISYLQIIYYFCILLFKYYFKISYGKTAFINFFLKTISEILNMSKLISNLNVTLIFAIIV